MCITMSVIYFYILAVKFSQKEVELISFIVISRRNMFNQRGKKKNLTQITQAIVKGDRV